MRAYRVWDKEKKTWCNEQSVYLGQDGYLYELDMDAGSSLLYPDFIREARLFVTGQFYTWSERKFYDYVREHQQDWYTLEFTTDSTSTT